MGKVCTGLDIGSTTCHVLAMDKEKSVLRDRRFDTGETNLIAAVEGLKGQVHVHIEASELAGWVRRVLTFSWKGADWQFQPYSSPANGRSFLERAVALASCN